MHNCDDGPFTHHGNSRSCSLASIFKEQTKEMIGIKVIFSAIFSLAAILVSNTKTPALIIFIWNLLAIIPLSVTLTEATERISKDLGETAGALLNITVGNLAELIIL
jgi:Ca2+:H+ antiporter